MIEDKLTRDERIRLEALSQAHAGGMIQRPVGEVLRRAKVLEGWIREGAIPEEAPIPEGDPRLKGLS